MAITLPTFTPLETACSCDYDFGQLDIDLPAAARQRLIPEHPNAHVIGADVREGTGWTPSPATGRPSSWPTG
jgi:hypothetical protein